MCIRLYPVCIRLYPVCILSFFLLFIYLFIYLFILICLFTNLSFGASVVALSIVIHNCFLKHWRFPLLPAVSAITEVNKEEEEEE